MIEAVDGWIVVCPNCRAENTAFFDKRKKKLYKSKCGKCHEPLLLKNPHYVDEGECKDE